MPRRENLVALGGTVLAALALLPLASEERLVCSGLAIVAGILFLTLRLRAHGAGRSRRGSDDIEATIARIRAGRERRSRR